MSVEVINKKVYRCTCEWKDCKHNWEAPTTDENGDPIDPPARCAKCKRFTWDGIDPDLQKKGIFRRKTETPKPKAIPIPKPTKRRKAAR